MKGPEITATPILEMKPYELFTTHFMRPSGKFYCTCTFTEWAANVPSEGLKMLSKKLDLSDVVLGDDS